MNDRPTPITGLLSDRIRPSCEAAPWVCEEVKNLEHQLAEALEEIERLKARIEGMEDDASEINERLEML